MKEYLNKIKNEEIRKMLELAIDNIPPYFYEIPASSSGKWHPSFALGRSGLLRHTIIATEIAIESFNIMDNYTQSEKDIVIAALLLHDTFKQGLNQGGHTVNNHPLIAAKFYYELWEGFEHTYRCQICDCISSHMGVWDSGILPRPKTKLEKFTHMCDFLASRKLWDKYNNLTKGENND